MIDAYREVTEQVPDAQLAMVGSMATDDPEGREYFQKTFEYADNDPDIKILSNLNNVGAIEVNAFQSQSDVCLQKSIREGFGLTVTEALWKGRPTIGGNVGGIPLQIEDGVSGFLVNSPEECAAALPRDPRRPGAGQEPRPRRQGARPPRVPLAAPAARLARALHRARSLIAPRRFGAAAPARNLCGRGRLLAADHRLQPRPGPVRTATRAASAPCGAAAAAWSRRSRAWSRHRDALWIASAMTDEDIAVSEEAGGPAELSIDGIDYRVCLVGSDPEAYDRFYNVIANPILWFIQHYLWDLSNAPDIRQEELDAWDYGYQAVNRDIADAVVAQIEGQDSPLVMLHDYHLYTAPGMIRDAAPGRLPPPLRPHPLVPAGQLAGAAAADPRGDLRRDAGQRHHRLPHPRLLHQLPPLLRRTAGSRGRLRDAARSATRAARTLARAYPLGIDAERLRAGGRLAGGGRGRARGAGAAAQAPDHPRRPRRPLEERAARLHRLRHLPHPAPGVPRRGHLHRPPAALAPGRARVRRVPGADRGPGRGRQPPPRDHRLDADRPARSTRTSTTPSPATSTSTC